MIVLCTPLSAIVAVAPAIALVVSGYFGFVSHGGSEKTIYLGIAILISLATGIGGFLTLWKYFRLMVATPGRVDRLTVGKYSRVRGPAECDSKVPIIEPKANIKCIYYKLRREKPTAGGMDRDIDDEVRMVRSFTVTDESGRVEVLTAGAQVLARTLGTSKPGFIEDLLLALLANTKIVGDTLGGVPAGDTVEVAGVVARSREGFRLVNGDFTKPLVFTNLTGVEMLTQVLIPGVALQVSAIVSAVVGAIWFA